MIFLFKYLEQFLPIFLSLYVFISDDFWQAFALVETRFDKRRKKLKKEKVKCEEFLHPPHILLTSLNLFRGAVTPPPTIIGLLCHIFSHFYFRICRYTSSFLKMLLLE